MKPKPEDLAKLAQVAAIRENPFAEIILPGGHKISTTTRKQFDAKIIGAIEAAHYSSSLANAAKLSKSAKKIGRLARELKDALEKSDGKQLVQFLPSPVDSCTTALNELAMEASRIAKAKRRAKWNEVTRKRFVTGLLDAAHSCGGQLGLNRRTGGGSLVEAVKLLAPYLPVEIFDKLSPATLRRIKQWWLKNKKNKVKKLLN